MGGGEGTSPRKQGEGGGHVTRGGTERAPSFLLRGAVCLFAEKRGLGVPRGCVRLCNELPSQVGGTGPVRSRPGEGNDCGSCHRFRGRCGDVRAVLMSRSDRNQDWQSPSTWLPLLSMTIALSLCCGV